MTEHDVVQTRMNVVVDRQVERWTEMSGSVVVGRP